MNKELLDTLEELVVDAVKPIAREMLAGLSNPGVDVTQASRNLVAKIGSRIMFGNGIADKVLGVKD
jgi:hypothetical protein